MWPRWPGPWRCREQTLLAIEQFASLPPEAQVLVGDWRTAYKHLPPPLRPPRAHARRLRRPMEADQPTGVGSDELCSGGSSARRQLLTATGSTAPSRGTTDHQQRHHRQRPLEAPVPEPDAWLVLDSDSHHASLEMWRAADAMVPRDPRHQNGVLSTPTAALLTRGSLNGVRPTPPRTSCERREAGQTARRRACHHGRPHVVNANGPPQMERPVALNQTGGVLLSRALAGQVPSALRGLTALFGMGRGVSPSQ
jgi:hypothetical protein